MDLTAFSRQNLPNAHNVALRTEAALSHAFVGLVDACVSSVRAGGKLMFFGNGGSAADAQHLAAELTVRYKLSRTAIAAIALTTDSSVLPPPAMTSVLTKSSPGRSKRLAGMAISVARYLSFVWKSERDCALKQARSMGLVTAALGGKGGSELAALADHFLVIAVRNHCAHPRDAYFGPNVVER